MFDYLPLGRFLYIIGDSPRAAELNGISQTLYVTIAFVASGVLAAFAGVILQAQLQVGQSTVGQELMLPAFTGALLGATAIRPGRPNVWGTLLAVAVLAVAVAGLTQLGAPFFVENLFNGAMLVLAVGLAGLYAAQSRPKKMRCSRRGEARTMRTGIRFERNDESSSPAPPTASEQRRRRSARSLGAELLLVDIRDADKVAAQIRETGGKAAAFVADVSTRAAIERLAAECRRSRRLGSQCSGLSLGRRLGRSELGRKFRPGDGGQRVRADPCRSRVPAGNDPTALGTHSVVGSLAGRTGGLIAGPHYAASKGGIHAFVKWLARRVGPDNVLVNGVAPASVDTPMMRDRPIDIARIPLGRMAAPDEVAWPIAFLCSTAASYVCGVVLDVNGGVYMG